MQKVLFFISQDIFAKNYLTFESFKQIERLEKEWSKDGNPFNWERIFRDRQYNNQRSINNSYYNINHHNFFRH